jgi:hypothetical protein
LLGNTRMDAGADKQAGSAVPQRSQAWTASGPTYSALMSWTSTTPGTERARDPFGNAIRILQQGKAAQEATA